MEIIAHGIDIIETDRVADMAERYGDRFLDRILTPTEKQYCFGRRNWKPHIAGRFAAKEAVLKVLGTGWRKGMAWTDIEITNTELGSPSVALSHYTADLARQKGIETILLSITHTPNYASASAIGLGRSPEP